MRIPKPRFGLAFALAMMTVCTVCIGVGVRYWSAMRREQLAAQYLSTHGATIYYQGISEYPPKWFQRLVGQQGFQNVARVDLRRTSFEERPLSTDGSPRTGWYSSSRSTNLGCDPNAVHSLRDLTQLRTLHAGKLDGREFTPDDLRGLGKLSHLESLTIFSSAFDAETNYEFFGNFPNLTYLCFQQNNAGSPVGGSSLGTLLEQLPKLEDLVLDSEHVTDESLFGLRNCHLLRSLRIHGGTLTHEGLAYVPAGKLSDLLLVNCGLRDSARLGETLSRFSHLRSLTIEACEVGDQVFRHLRLPELKTVHVSQTRITIDSLYSLSSLPRLKRTYQSANQITEAELEQFRYESDVDVR